MQLDWLYPKHLGTHVYQGTSFVLIQDNREKVYIEVFFNSRVSNGDNASSGKGRDTKGVRERLRLVNS